MKCQGLPSTIQSILDRAESASRTITVILPGGQCLQFVRPVSYAEVVVLEQGIREFIRAMRRRGSDLDDRSLAVAHVLASLSELPVISHDEALRLVESSGTIVSEIIRQLDESEDPE